MINKTIDNFEEIKNDYESKLNTASLEEQAKIKNKFKDSLKLYLFDSNKIIKETFGFDPSPFFKEEGYTRMFQKGGVQISKKNKEQYYNDLDNLLSSSTFYELDDTKKALINNAIYILKTYYEDSLN